jgi:hypothetical protein
LPNAARLIASANSSRSLLPEGFPMAHLQKLCSITPADCSTGVSCTVGGRRSQSMQKCELPIPILA